MKMPLRIRLPLVVAAGLGLHGIAAHAQLIINDTLTGASSSYDWFLPGTTTTNAACLTAGDGTGKIPKCVGKAAYSGKTLVGGTTGRLPDLPGYGALRLSNGDWQAGTNGNNQTGSIVSNFTFPTNEGIQVTWTSVSYGGNNYNGTGADGIVFFLSDGTQTPTIGAFGGSLGYSCANSKNPTDGVIGGYLGIGIDEYGNFAYKGDNTNTGNVYKPGRISVRGAGATALTALRANYPTLYPTAGTDVTSVQKTCASGHLYNFSGSNKVDSSGATISTGNQMSNTLLNYPLLYSVDVPAATPLANQQAVNMPLRSAATPIIFALKITSAGLLDFSYSINGGSTQTVVSGFNITASNGALPSSFRFGFSSGTGGGSNVHEITCFKATPANVSNSTAGSNVQQSGKVIAGNQVFLAYYHPVNWWGSMTSNALTYDVATDTLAAATTATWDGNCVLTGGTCQATGGTTVVAQASASRTMLSWNNSTTSPAAIAFQWASLSTAQKASFNVGDSLGSDRLDYLRGVRTKEVASGGPFRDRTSVLGDIVDSSPVFVGPPSFDYANTWVDKLYTGTQPEGVTYAAFASTNATRTNVVYIGANDGMLHAFRAGTPTAAGSGTLTNNDGRELLAYVPGQVVNVIHNANDAYDYSGIRYGHNFFVDAQPGSGDLFYNSAWHTWLVSGLGVGGHVNGPVNTNTATIAAPVSALFALDITDPTAFAETAGGLSTVLGEWTSATIVCATNPTCGTHFGQTVGTPIIRRLHDGSWGVIWGNGLNSASGRAGIFIMHVASNGTKTFQYLDAGPGPGNGIVQVAAGDLNDDHITDFVYAGDVLGNVWRFDLTGQLSSTWATAITTLFTASSGQPITTSPLISAIPAANGTGNPKILVSFGTGQKQPITLTLSESYASGTQSLYGIWDANMSAWNTASANYKYDVLAATGQPLSPSVLQAQTVTAATLGTDGTTYRSVSTNTVCWSGSTACTSGNTAFGWKLDLPSAGEQAIYDPVQVQDSFVINTVIPQTVQALTCQNTTATGFTMAVDITNGGGDNAPFPDGTNSYSGAGVSGTGTVAVLIQNDKYHLGTETADGSYKVLKFNFKGGNVSRVTWTKVR
ncbi:MAG: PilC/PilY family type IV pilus protein [Betaproteobacteria bacterium]